jgi:hypothetical protein
VAADDLALVANFLYRCPYLHIHFPVSSLEFQFSAG